MQGSYLAQGETLKLVQDETSNLPEGEILNLPEGETSNLVQDETSNLPEDETRTIGNGIIFRYLDILYIQLIAEYLTNNEGARDIDSIGILRDPINNELKRLYIPDNNEVFIRVENDTFRKIKESIQKKVNKLIQRTPLEEELKAELKQNNIKFKWESTNSKQKDITPSLNRLYLTIQDVKSLGNLIQAQLYPENASGAPSITDKYEICTTSAEGMAHFYPLNNQKVELGSCFNASNIFLSSLNANATTLTLRSKEIICLNAIQKLAPDDLDIKITSQNGKLRLFSRKIDKTNEKEILKELNLTKLQRIIAEDTGDLPEYREEFISGGHDYLSWRVDGGHPYQRFFTLKENLEELNLTKLQEVIAQEIDSSDSPDDIKVERREEFKKGINFIWEVNGIQQGGQEPATLIFSREDINSLVDGAIAEIIRNSPPYSGNPYLYITKLEIKENMQAKGKAYMTVYYLTENDTPVQTSVSISKVFIDSLNNIARLEELHELLSEKGAKETPYISPVKPDPFGSLIKDNPAAKGFLASMCSIVFPPKKATLQPE